MKLSAIHHIAVIGSDYARSRAFYADTLGFAVLRENYRPDKRDWKIDLKISDDTELEALGVACEPIRTDTFTGKKMTFFHDPDGLPLELHE